MIKHLIHQSRFSIRNTRNSRNNLEPQGFDLLRNENTQHVTTKKHVTHTQSHILSGNNGNSGNTVDFKGEKSVTTTKTKAVTHQKAVTKLGFIRFSMSSFDKLHVVFCSSPIPSFTKFLSLAIASCDSPTYAKALSNSHSVTPQRHCGFIVPNFCNASQAMQNTGTSVTATPTRLQSLYEGMTRQNKPMANMSGGSMRPRVNPLTLISQISVNLKNLKLIGGNHA